ncbi:MAG: histidinol dehydrogenase [Candidatus Hodgkinia cicadicola]
MAINLNSEAEWMLIQLKFSYDRILSYHLQQMHYQIFYTAERGICLVQNWTPIKSIGVYLLRGTQTTQAVCLWIAFRCK